MQIVLFTLDVSIQITLKTNLPVNFSKAFWRKPRVSIKDHHANFYNRTRFCVWFAVSLNERTRASIGLITPRLGADSFPSSYHFITFIIPQEKFLRLRLAIITISRRISVHEQHKQANKWKFLKSFISFRGSHFLFFGISLIMLKGEKLSIVWKLSIESGIAFEKRRNSHALRKPSLFRMMF